MRLYLQTSMQHTPVPQRTHTSMHTQTHAQTSKGAEIIACILTGAWHTLPSSPSEINTLANAKQAKCKTSETHVFLAVQSHCFPPVFISETDPFFLFGNIQVQNVGMCILKWDAQAHTCV